MPVYPITRVNISLQTAGSTRQGFGTPLFIGAHRWFSERVLSFGSREEAASVLPSESNEYKAVLAAFKQSPAPAVIKIGRREADAILTPTSTTVGDEYTLSIEVNTGHVADVTYTVQSGDTEEDIVDAIKAAIDGDATVATHTNTTKNGTGASTTLTITAATSGDYFILSGLSSNIGFSFDTEESASDVYTAIFNEDSDFSIIAAHDHTWTFVEDLADVIETSDKMYFVSVGGTGPLSAYSVSSTDVLARLKQGNYAKTAGFYHHLADTTFPEVGIMAQNIVYTPGEVTWTNNRIAGVTISKHPTTGLALTTTQKGYLESRNASYIDTELGNDIVRGGKTANGEWIDTIRSKDYWIARLKEANTSVFINQKGSKLGYNRKGISTLEAACITVSNQLLSDDKKSRALESYEFSFPNPEDITAEDRASGLLTVPFKGVLTGAITMAVFEGTLSFG